MTNGTNQGDKPTFSTNVESEVKSSVIEIYEDLLNTVWLKISPTLGAVTVITIIQRSIDRAAKNHPVLSHLSVDEEGLDFTEIREKIGEENRRELAGSFKELIANLFDILAKLTGNILVKQLIREVDGLDVESDGEA